MNKAEKVYQSVQNHCPSMICHLVNPIFEGMKNADTVKQGEMIRDCLLVLEQHNVDIQSIMRECNCLPELVVQRARQYYLEANENIEAFLKKLNEAHIGGGHLSLNESNHIMAIYKKCYCDVSEMVQSMPASYCECSVGWIEKLISGAINRPVKAKRIQSILDGSDECIFEIEYDIKKGA